MRPKFQKTIFILQIQILLGIATAMEKTEKLQNQRRALKKLQN